MTSLLLFHISRVLAMYESLSLVYILFYISFSLFIESGFFRIEIAFLGLSWYMLNSILCYSASPSLFMLFVPYVFGSPTLWLLGSLCWREKR